MKPETYQRAVSLDGRIRNVSGAYERIFNASPTTPTYKIELVGLPDGDREAIAQLVLKYLDTEQIKAQADFDAL